MEKKINWWKIAAVALVLLAFLTGGFFLGRAFTEPEYIEGPIKYIPSDPIHDTVSIDKPYKVVEPIDTASIIAQCVRDGIYYELFPERVRDSIIYVTKEDTTAILRDYAAEKYYSDVLFDVDTLGKCTVDTKVQYNRLMAMSYEFVPVTKTQTNTVVKTKKFSPFIGAGISTLPSVGVCVGGYISEKWGLQVEGQYNINPAGIENFPKYDLGMKVLRKF